MPSVLELQCHAVLSAAASSELGIVIQTQSPQKARNSLYTFRKSFGDPTFNDLHIRVSPNDSEHELWIIRRPQARSGFTFDSPI